MIILISNNHKVLSRWNEAMPEGTCSANIGNLQDLYHYAHNHPDATIVLHYSIDGLNGVTGIKTLHSNFPESKILVLEDVPSEINGVEMIKSGVLGYGNTYIDQFVLYEAIKVVSMGEIWISKRFVQWLACNCRNFSEETLSRMGDAPFNNLTPGEIKILDQLMNGNSNKIIAKKLNISERTVKAHLTSIFRKTGIKDRLHLVLRASGKAAG